MVKHEEILEAVTARSDWETRQATWAKMRNEGLGRRKKPWPGAADMHFPLGDMAIEKIKPYYIQQVFAQDTVATFSALKLDLAAYQAAAGQWFDYQVKQQSNFEDEIVITVDRMLEKAKCLVKVFWDSGIAGAGAGLRFEAIDPMMVIVPAWTERIDSADWIVHVQHFSKAAYKRRNDFRQDPEFVNSICGRGDSAGADDSGAQAAAQEKADREGITYGNQNMIVIWEVFERRDGGGWQVRTYSPVRPRHEVRETFGLPYYKGAFAKGLPPFAEFNAEIKDRGYYSGRGIMQRLAPFEQSICKDWNTQKDYQSLTCTPMFSAANGLPANTNNLRMTPGQILPFKVDAVQFPQAPVDLIQSMTQTRMIGEQLVAVPDAGAMNNIGQKPRTATEASMIGAMMGQNVDMRARIFRRELGRLFQLAWSLLLQYRGDTLGYYYSEELLELPPTALSEQYLIEPSGSGDNMNKQMVMAKAVARKQMFTNNPNIDQYELDKSVLEADDPRLVKRLLKNAGTQQAEQVEDQGLEICNMMNGCRVQVRPTDDDAAHLQTLLGFVNRRNSMREPLTAEQMQLMAQHGTEHLAALKKKNPPAHAQMAPQAQPLLQQLGQMAAQVAQAEQEAKQYEQMQAGAAPMANGQMPGQAAERTGMPMGDGGF